MEGADCYSTGTIKALKPISGRPEEKINAALICVGLFISFG
jgi:hypothetical protein